MPSDGPRTTLLGKLVILAFIGACAWGAYQLFLRRGGKPLLPEPERKVTTLRIASSDEKRAWLKEAAAGFAQKDVVVEIVPLDAPEPNVWAPPSSMERPATPALNEKSIASTPLVLLMRGDRLPVFRAKWGEPSLATIAHALAEPRGWEAAGHADWGLVKFAIADRDAVLALVACEEPRVLELASKAELKSLARNATEGPLDPESFDAALVYEPLVEELQKRQPELQPVELKRNLFADNPYYILDAPWSTPDQRSAAQAFLEYLLAHTPPSTAAKGGTACPLPSPAAIANLRAAWQRAR